MLTLLPPRFLLFIGLIPLPFTEDADDYQEVADQADDRCHDNPSNRENIGFEGLFITTGTSHQRIPCYYYQARCYDDVATGHKDTDGMFNAVEYSVHIDECIG